MPQQNEVLNNSAVAESLFGKDFQIQSVGESLRDLASAYNRAISAQNTQLATLAHEAAHSLIASESGMLQALMLSHFVKHAGPATAKEG